MVRALEKYFGVTPDLDIEEQRATLVLNKPMAIDWKHVADMIKRANYTFGGAHLRARGRPVRVEERPFFEFAGSGQRMPLKYPDEARSLASREAVVVAAVEDWKDEPKLRLIAEK